MSQLNLGRWATLALIFFSAVGTLSSADPVEESWQRGVEALKANNIKGAEPFLTEVSRLVEVDGARSPEVHFNLGLVYWELKQPGPAVYHLLQSTQSYFSPFRIRSTLATVAGIQRELGLRDSPAEDWFFGLSLALPENLAWVLFTLGFWGLAAAGILRWTTGSRSLRAARQVAIVPGALFSIALLIFAIRWLTPDFGVLVDDQNGIRVYRSPQAIEENRLVELPSGTLVITGRKERGYTEIQSPVAGWVISGSSLDPRVFR